MKLALPFAAFILLVNASKPFDSKPETTLYDIFILSEWIKLDVLQKYIISKTIPFFSKYISANKFI